MYRPRITDSILEDLLGAMGAVLIEGPKACGKSTSAAQLAKSVLQVDEPSKHQQNQILAQTNINLLLEGDTPRLLDEWQVIPTLWDAVRHTVDKRCLPGQFILTGSAVPCNSGLIHHSGTGRIARLRMRPMTLWESGESTGEVSLKALFEKQQLIVGHNSFSLEDIAKIACRGGWPLAINQKDTRFVFTHAKQYVQSVAKSDVSRVDGVQRNPERVMRIMRSLARNIGTQASIDTILNDINSNEDAPISDKTIQSYLTALTQIFVIENMPAWNPNLRSKTAIRTSDTRYFIDPSIATASLGLGPKDLMADLKYFGFVFESMCIRDLRVYADKLEGQVYHYRDKSNLECDAVIHLDNGRYGLIEIKLGGDTLIQEGVENLLKLEKNIDTSKMPSPSFKIILTAVGDYAFQRPDGIYIVPIGCLKD